MEKSKLTSLDFLLNVFIDDCISLFNISREIEKPKNLHLSNKTYRASHKLNIFIKQSTMSSIKKHTFCLSSIE